MVKEALINVSLIIGLVAIITILARIIKQPPIIAYLISGIFVGPLFLNYLNPSTVSLEVIQVLAQIGVALLLFIVGLSLDLRLLKNVGAVSTVTAIGQMALISAISFFIAIGFGFNNLTSIYIAAALAFSSTVVVVKILSDKREIDSLTGHISLGILIIQDIVAAIALLLFPLIDKGDSTLILLQLGKIIALTIIIFVTASFVTKKVFEHAAKNQETLFISGIAWALIIAALFDSLGLSLEIGALIAGMAVASSKYNLEISGKLKPLRDFFIVLFFVYFGSLLAPPINSDIIQKALVFSALVFFGKPLIVMGFMRIMGYKKRTNFLTGFSLAQISEFSLILILLGFTLGHINQEIMSLTVLIAIFTIGLSSYTAYFSNTIYNSIASTLNVFEGKRKEEKAHRRDAYYDVILIGAHRAGSKILETLKKMKLKFIVIDYNPKTINLLTEKGVPCIYGDVNDKEFINELKLAKVKMIISTVPSTESDIIIRDKLEELGSSAIFLATSEHISDAKRLYKKGVDYVILPYHLGGTFVAHMIEKNKFDYKKYKAHAKEHLESIKKLKND